MLGFAPLADLPLASAPEDVLHRATTFAGTGAMASVATIKLAATTAFAGAGTLDTVAPGVRIPATSAFGGAGSLATEATGGSVPTAPGERGNTRSSGARTWRSIVLEADPDWAMDSEELPEYQFRRRLFTGRYKHRGAYADD